MSSGQQVLIKLRKMIIAGELEGGSRIAEIPTAEMLGVSRQPVRMAFRLLEQEGLLIKNPNLSHCIEQTEKLFEGKTEFGDEELESYHHWNVIFHDTVIQGAGNIALTQALAKNNQLPMASAQALTYDQSRALSEYRRLHYAHLQHCSIYDALVQRQAGRAESLMREHSAVVMLGETVKHILST